jgi:hypothetical protein
MNGTKHDPGAKGLVSRSKNKRARCKAGMPSRQNIRYSPLFFAEKHLWLSHFVQVENWSGYLNRPFTTGANGGEGVW